MAEAYANLPTRDGKRGTRNLQRQSNRWRAVRKIKATQKQFKVKAHFRKMEKRSRIVKEVLSVKEDAPALRERDAAYQQWVLEKWASSMVNAREEESKSA